MHSVLRVLNNYFPQVSLLFIKTRLCRLDQNRFRNPDYTQMRNIKTLKVRVSFTIYQRMNRHPRIVIKLALGIVILWIFLSLLKRIAFRTFRQSGGQCTKSIQFIKKNHYDNSTKPYVYEVFQYQFNDVYQLFQCIFDIKYCSLINSDDRGFCLIKLIR